jgi:hypothetical protein
MKKLLQEKYMLPLSGVLVGLIALTLVKLGNPQNMGLCSACFLRDTAGALGLHQGPAYLRPEIPGIVLGAFLISMMFRGRSVRGGSAPLTRFVLGMAVMVGALIFMGCPLRMLLRIAGGDLDAAIGLLGFIPGVATGVFFLNRGFTLERSHPQPKAEGYIVPLAACTAAAAVVSGWLFSSEGAFFQPTNPAMSRAPVWIALAAGVIVGIVGHRTRLCFISGVRDAMLFKQFSGLWAFAAILLTVHAGNWFLYGGPVRWEFKGEALAYNQWIWGILGLYLVGFASVLLGGCPLRQLVLAGSGNSDAGITVLGLMAGAALAHTFDWAVTWDGMPTNGRITLVVFLVLTLGIAMLNVKRGDRS